MSFINYVYFSLKEKRFSWLITIINCKSTSNLVTIYSLSVFSSWSFFFSYTFFYISLQYGWSWSMFWNRKTSWRWFCIQWSCSQVCNLYKLPRGQDASKRRKWPPKKYIKWPVLWTNDGHTATPLQGAHLFNVH